MDQNYKGVCTTRPPGKQLDLWSQRRWDNKKLFTDGNMDGCEDGWMDGWMDVLFIDAQP